MPRQATTEEPQWQSLLRNHLYRFKITAFTYPGPAPDITQTILVRWYYTVSKCYGKFNFELYDNLKVKKSSGWETFTTSTLGNHNRWPTRTFEILLDKIPSSKNIPYVFSSSSKGIQCTEGNLFEDAVFYGIDEETGNTIFILNNPIVSGGSTKMLKWISGIAFIVGIVIIAVLVLMVIIWCLRNMILYMTMTRIMAINMQNLKCLSKTTWSDSMC